MNSCGRIHLDRTRATTICEGMSKGVEAPFHFRTGEGALSLGALNG